MPLKLAEVQLEDFETMINHASLYLPEENLIGMPTPLCWKVSSKLEAQERLRFHMSQQKRRFLGDSTARYLKIIDDETGDIISLARWHYYPNGYVYAKEIDWEVHNPVEGKSFPEGMNIELHNFILRERDAERKNWMVDGEACWILMHLVTRESQRGRGAAGLLVSWGVERARRDGVPAYLEAAALARPMYEKYGFRQIGEPFMLDLRPHGVDMDNFIAKMGILATK